MRKIKELKNWVNGYSGVNTALEELQLAYDFYREEVATEEEVDEAYRVALEQVETLEDESHRLGPQFAAGCVR